MKEDQLARPGLQDRQGQAVRVVNQDLRDHLVLRVQKEHKDLLDLKDHLDQLEIRER